VPRELATVRHQPDAERSHGVTHYRSRLKVNGSVQQVQHFSIDLYDSLLRVMQECCTCCTEPRSRRPRPRTTSDPRREFRTIAGGRDVTWSFPQDRPTLMRTKCLDPTISSGGAAFQCPWCTPTRVGDMDKVASEGLNFVGTYGNSWTIST